MPIEKETAFNQIQPEIVTYTITHKGESCIIRKPDRKVLAKIVPLMFPDISGRGGEPDFLGAGELILTLCYISGSQKFLLEDEFILAGAMSCVGLIDIGEPAQIKKN